MARAPASLPDRFRDFLREREFEDKVYQTIDDNFVIEKTGRFAEVCQRAAGRLNAVRAPEPPLRPVVVWVSQPSAFTTCGAYVYISRRLLERLREEDSVAFVLAHEMAHHDLGHVRGGVGLPTALVRLAQHWVRGEERERAADDLAIDLCEKAGYDRRRCLLAFDSMMAVSLDYRDLDGAFGTDDELGVEELTLRGRAWKALRRRSHPPVLARRDRLRTGPR